MYEKNIRNYIQVSIVVQAYQSYPKMVMESIENDTLQNMIQDMACLREGSMTYTIVDELAYRFFGDFFL